MKPARDPAYRAWIRGLFCVVCGSRPCDPHHAIASKTAQKASDYTCIPLCRQHHDEALNRKAFAARYRLDIPGIIRRFNGAYFEWEAA